MTATTTIAISGASGHLGRRVAELVLEEAGDGTSVVLLTRTPAKLADLAARGAEVRAADFDDPAGLRSALAGVDRLLLVSTDAIGRRIEQQAAAIAAAKAAGVGHVIYTSAPQPTESNPATVGPDHRATEEALQASGLAWTILRNNLYSEFLIADGAPAVASGQMFTNAGDGAVAYVTREDCARAAAAVLASGGHEGAVYDITGPEAITRVRFAALLTEVTGQPVAVVPVDDASLSAGLEQAGLPAEVVPVLVSFGASAREGYLDTVSTAVRDLTGTDPAPLVDVLTASRDQLVAIPA